MRTKVGKWGNSLAIRIPASLAEEAELGDGVELEVTVEDGELRARPADRGLTLDELLDQLDPSTLHGEVDWGPPVGKEVW